MKPSMIAQLSGTIRSFFREADDQFGKSPGMSANHRKRLVTIAKDFGDRLSGVHRHAEP